MASEHGFGGVVKTDQEEEHDSHNFRMEPVRKLNVPKLSKRIVLLTGPFGLPFP